jgi:hypothetical protein
VIHDAPPWLDPLRPVPPALTTPAVRSREPDFVFVSQTPQGLRTYARTSDTGEPTLLIMPRGTWVMGNPLVLARVAIAYARSPGPPPFLPAAPGSFEDTFVGKARPPRWVPFADQVLGGGFTFYPIREGAPAAVVFKVMYRDARTASAAAQDLRGLWQARVLPAQAERDDDDWKAFLTDIGDVRADGAMVRVESNVPPKVAAQFVNDAL